MSAMELPEGETFDIDLGDNHMLHFFTYSGANGRRVGAIIYHLRPGPPRDPALWTPWCAGSVAWERAPGEPGGPLWTIHGAADEHLTLSPSILCGCGDHGYIRQGRWERA